MKFKSKLVFGVGVNDVEYNVKPRKEIACPYYVKWTDMLRRCYSEIRKGKVCYNDCTVCSDWKYFSNFREWMESQDWIGKVLDKDLKLRGNKIYSPDTCIFISPDVNRFMADSRVISSGCYVGVTRRDRGKVTKFEANCSNTFGKTGKYLGAFDSELKAHKAWQEKKLEYAIALSELPENSYLSDLLIRRYTFKEDEICEY